MTANDFPFEVELARLDHELSGTLRSGNATPQRRLLAAEIETRPDWFFTVPMTQGLREAIEAGNAPEIVAALKAGGRSVPGRVGEDNSGWYLGDDLDSRFEGNPRQLLVLIVRPPRGSREFRYDAPLELAAKAGAARQPGAGASIGAVAPSRKLILNDPIVEGVADKLVSAAPPSIEAACAKAH